MISKLHFHIIKLVKYCIVILLILNIMVLLLLSSTNLEGNSHYFMGGQNGEMPVVTRKLVGNTKGLKVILRSLYEKAPQVPSMIVPELNCTFPYVSITSTGRLGNNICQFMSIFIFRIEFGIRVAISSEMKKRLQKLFILAPFPLLPHECFENSANTSYETDFYSMYGFFQKRFFKENNLNKTYHLQYSELPYLSYINNNACPWQKLVMYRDYFRALLNIRKPFLSIAQMKIDVALMEKGITLSSNLTLVSVHVRRKDHLNYAERFNLTLPKKSFYDKGFHFYRTRCKNVIFVVLSDDMVYVKEHFSDPDVIFPGDGDINIPEFDYAIMTQCQHHIVGLGTYARTSAFLSQGSVFFYIENMNQTYFTNFNNDFNKKFFDCRFSESYIVEGN